MRVFNLAEELEKERKKNKELEKQLNCKKEFTKYLPKDTEFIILTKPDYDRQQEELQDKVFELEEENKKLNNVIYKDYVIKDLENKNEWLKNDNRVYKSRIDKTIDILKKRINKIENQEWKSYTGQTDEEYLQEQKELLNILKGDNKYGN